MKNGMWNYSVTLHNLHYKKQKNDNILSLSFLVYYQTIYQSTYSYYKGHYLKNIPK